MTITIDEDRLNRAAPATAKLPPGPRVPKLYAGYAVIGNHMPTLDRWQRRYGDAFTLTMPIYGPAVVISNPTFVKQMFTASPEVLQFAEGSPLASVLGRRSLFGLDGNEHLRERRLLLPPFHGESVKSYEGIIEQETIREMAGWKEGVEFASMPSFMQITLRSILRAVFGAEGPNQRELADLLPGLVSLGSILAALQFLHRDLGPFSPGGRFVRLRRKYDQVIEKMIGEALADPELEERVDVMALLLRAHYEDGSTMSHAAIADELLALLAAGHETTATSLAWAVDRLRRHPQILARLQEEADAGGKELRTATIHELQRTRPVINGVDRGVAVDTFELGDWRIPRGYRLIALATLIHNDSRFFERPDEFDPDRFLGRSPDTYTWIPFGGGTRRCIGAAFAQMEMSVVLRTVLREFDLKPTDKADEKWKARGIAFAPAEGGQAMVRRRNGRRAASTQP